jgi:hypothetical protein
MNADEHGYTVCLLLVVREKREERKNIPVTTGLFASFAFFADN